MGIKLIPDEYGEYNGSAYLDMQDGTCEFIYEWAALELLATEQLFVACGNIGYTSLELMVICNDIFYWGTADCERIPAYELEDLYKMWKKDPQWGTAKWCCMKRNLKPQSPIIKSMKEYGSWDEIMEALPDNKC